MSDIDITPIPDQFFKSGFEHHLQGRNGPWALFRRGKPGKSQHYEVVRLHVADRKNLKGAWHPCPPYEVYPSSERWGLYGFTFSGEGSEERARDFLNSQTKSSQP